MTMLRNSFNYPYFSTLEPKPRNFMKTGSYARSSTPVPAWRYDLDRSPVSSATGTYPPHTRCRTACMKLKASPISTLGACRVDCRLRRRMTKLKASKPSVAISGAGPSHRIWARICRRMWNFGLLNHQVVHMAVAPRKSSIAFESVSYKIGLW